MGLDMYLYAERHFDPASEEGLAVLRAADISFAELERRAGLDMMTELEAGPLYLARWSFMREHGGREAAKVAEAERVLAAAGLLPAFDHAEANSGYLGLTPEGDKLYCQIEAAYWRKANAVHTWFVDNCQGGVDECQESDPISGEQLALLRSKCLEAMTAYKNGDYDCAGAIMAPRSGFFFGGYDVNEAWLDDMMETVTAVERVIHAAIEVGGITFRYHSSW